MSEDRTVTKETLPLFGIEYRPRYYSEYHCSVGYVCTSECTSCGAKALYEDMHPAQPCRNCGSKLQERVGKWIPEQSTGFLWWKRIVSKGHWKQKEKT